MTGRVVGDCVADDLRRRMRGNISVKPEIAICLPAYTEAEFVACTEVLDHYERLVSEANRRGGRRWAGAVNPGRAYAVPGGELSFGDGRGACSGW